jgi:hypothetical protein
MGKEYYDRYQDFKFNGGYQPLPFIKIEPKPTDKTVVYQSQISRLDKLSQKYYGNPYHGWLILLANSRYGGVEESIPDNEIIRIPYPFKDSIQQYIFAVNRYFTLYGNNN